MDVIITRSGLLAIAGGCRKIQAHEYPSQWGHFRDVSLLGKQPTKKSRRKMEKDSRKKNR